MEQNFLKITYHLGNKKMNAYLKMPSPTYSVLKKEIELCLFEERKQPRCEIRTYWIDDDQDEIEIVNQCDYEIFMAKRSDRKHLQVAPLNQELEQEKENITVEAAAATLTAVPSTDSSTSSSSADKQAKIPPAAGSSQSSSNYDFAVHDHVECDACLMSPIMGFRYKCIQCPNYDLCQNCESKHIHSEHMMVRMPTNNCPSVIEAYVTGSTTKGRRHSKRSKTSCPFVKNGISIVLDDDNDNNNATTSGNTAEAGAEQPSSSPGNGKERHHGRKHHRRHHRHNFFSHLYEMMHDLAEGGGAAAAAHAMGETETTSATKATTTTTTSSTSGPETTTTTKTSTTTSGTGMETMEDPIGAAAAAAAAQFASQHAHEAAVKAAEIAAKVAHEVAVNAASTFTSSQPSTSADANEGTATQTADKEASKEKADNTSAETPPNSVPVIPSPSLETLAQFLDPQYMKTGIQILNNFSDMFAKMLDPMDISNETQNENQLYPNLRKNSTTSSTKSSTNSNINSLDGEKKSDKEKSIEKEQTIEMEKQPDSDVSSHIEIDDLGSDSENDSVSESFIKLDAPKESNASTASTSKSVSAQTTPPQSLDKSKPMDFAQLSADLKAHIAEEAKKATETNKDSTMDSVDNAKTTTQTSITSTTTAGEPVVSTTSNSSSTTSTSTSTTSTTKGDTTPKKPEEKRAVPVYHADPHINNAVLAMMAMGFSNEGASLTQLLESVNGNIPEALDLMTVVQRGGR